MQQVAPLDAGSLVWLWHRADAGLSCTLVSTLDDQIGVPTDVVQLGGRYCCTVRCKKFCNGRSELGLPASARLT